MKNTSKILLAISASALICFSAFKMVGSAWTVNAKTAKITFNMPNGKHSGTVSEMNATLDFDPSHPELAAIKAIIETKSIQADNPKLTEHLMTTDFFDAANHPQITFTAEQVTKNDSGFVATGKLAMRDSVHTVNIPFTFKPSKGNEKEATINGTLDIFAGDYGVGTKSKSGSDRVVIAIEITATKE